LMPETAKVVRDEETEAARIAEEEAARIEAEQRETADREAREEEERREREREAANAEQDARRQEMRERLMDSFMEGKIDKRAFAAATRRLDGASEVVEGDEDGDAAMGDATAGTGNDEGEPEVATDKGDDDDVVAVVGERRAEKRKRTETIGGLREVSGKVRNHAACTR
jgi:hypothetical protein